MEKTVFSKATCSLTYPSCFPLLNNAISLQAFLCVFVCLRACFMACICLQCDDGAPMQVAGGYRQFSAIWVRASKPLEPTLRFALETTCAFRCARLTRDNFHLDMHHTPVHTCVPHMHTQCEQCMELCVDDVHLQTIIKIIYIMHACCVAKMVYTCMLCQDAAVSQVSVFFPQSVCVCVCCACLCLASATVGARLGRGRRGLTEGCLAEWTRPVAHCELRTCLAAIDVHLM